MIQTCSILKQGCLYPLFKVGRPSAPFQIDHTAGELSFLRTINTKLILLAYNTFPSEQLHTKNTPSRLSLGKSTADFYKGTI